MARNQVLALFPTAVIRICVGVRTPKLLQSPSSYSLFHFLKCRSTSVTCSTLDVMFSLILISSRYFILHSKPPSPNRLVTWNFSLLCLYYLSYWGHFFIILSQNCIELYLTVLNVLSCIALYLTVFSCIKLYWTVLNYNELWLYWTALICTEPHWTVLNCIEH